jgi:hypothetical protein
MNESARGTPGRIFISYRREETAYPAGWLFDRLSEHYGGQVFKDVDSIEPGDDFVERITEAVASCDVLLALIGDQWLSMTDRRGRRRIDDPDDFVRIEIEAALSRNVRVIPILVGGARMPSSEELPEGLARLGRRQALELSPARFDFDTGRLVKVLDETLKEVRGDTDAQPTAAAPVPGHVGPERLAAPARAPAAAPTEPSPRHTAAVGSATAPLASTGEAVRPGRAAPPSGRSKVSRRTMVLAGAGALVALVAVVLAISANTDGTPSTADGSGSTVLLEDDFSSQGSGWDNGGDTSGHYVGGAYVLDTSTGAAKTVHSGNPNDVSALYPNAPQNITVEVDARMLAGEDPDSYGVTCREGPEGSRGYAFSIEAGSIAIYKFVGSDSQQLATASSSINREERHHLRVTCRNGDSGVDLTLTVDDETPLTHTDADAPYLGGTVALFAFPAEGSSIPVKAEFDNFRATQE